ncbi:MAG TPA: acetylglutamate kinase [Candidatus Acidoferrales bacterium]|nr:acetylglutamate kinase [Candidatus Acidoferrales bacterium]
MEHNYSTPLVVKYGGSVADVIPTVTPSVGAQPRSRGTDELLASAVALQRGGSPVVLVHGGGPEIDRWLAQRDVVTRRVDGLRVTDDTTLEVTEAVLCATINKRLVRACAALGAKAVGVSGEDAGTLVATRARGSHGEDLGYVGDVTASDPALLELLLGAGYLPVVAPLAIADDASHAFNVNADLAAAAIAGALHARAFIMVTNVERVRRDPKDPGSAIDRMTLDEAKAFALSPSCEGGMKPKMQAAISAVQSGAAASYICAPQPLDDILKGNATIVSLV